MDEQKQDGQLELIYNSSVPIRDITMKTSRERWTIETDVEWGSGRSVLTARHKDDEMIFLMSYTVLKSLHELRQKSPRHCIWYYGDFMSNSIFYFVNCLRLSGIPRESNHEEINLLIKSATEYHHVKKWGVLRKGSMFSIETTSTLSFDVILNLRDHSASSQPDINFLHPPLSFLILCIQIY